MKYRNTSTNAANVPPTVQLYEMKHFLKNIREMGTQALSKITDIEKQAYEVEYEKNFTPAQVAVAKTTIENGYVVAEKLRLIYGDGSKQVKYFDRQRSSDESLCDIHNAKTPSPNEVFEAIKSARLLHPEQNSSHPSRDDDELSFINAATKYLIDHEYVLGADFTISNSITMACSHIQENLNSMLNASGDTPVDVLKLAGYNCAVTSDCQSIRWNPTSTSPYSSNDIGTLNLEFYVSVKGSLKARLVPAK